MADTENLPPRRSTRLRSGTSTTQDPSYEPLKSSTSSIAPLRISKSTSRGKALSAMAEDTTLKDISPGSSRRNSPSTFQIKDKIASFQDHINRSPPASPQIGLPKSDSANSVRSFWQNAATSSTPTEESGHKRNSSKTEIEKNIRSSLVKNNIFLAKDMRERESSPKLTMSPSQQRLSSQLGEITQKQPTSNASPSRIPAPVDTAQSPRKEMRPTSVAEPKASCLHSTRIKGPRENMVDESSSPQPLPSRRERRKTVTFDQAPEVHEYDRRSSHGTTASDRSSQYSDNHEDENADGRPLPNLPASRPLPQVPSSEDSDDERPESKQSNHSDYGDMEERIRSMMERVVLRDTEQKKTLDNSDQDDIFSLYTNVNELSDDEPHSQESKVFSSRETDSTGLSSQSQTDSLDEELELERLQKQSEELLQAVRSRPFSLAELPDLGFGDEKEDDGLGLREYCTPEPVVNKETPTSPAPSVSAQVDNLAITEKPPAPISKDIRPQPQQTESTESITPPITPPLASSEQFTEPETPNDQIIPPPSTLPSTPPSSPTKLAEEEDSVPSPVVPESQATIRSRGGSKLRVRPSLSRQEAEQIVERRRRKSEVPPLPPLPNLAEGSVEPEVRVKIEEDEDLCEFGGKLAPLKSEGLPLMKIERLGFEKEGLGGGFGEMAVEEMERVIEAQKVCLFKYWTDVAWVYDETALKGCSCVE